MDNKNRSESANMKLAASIRQACIEAARVGFRDASVSGLCSEGAMEAAIGAIQSLELKQLIQNEECDNDEPDN